MMTSSLSVCTDIMLYIKPTCITARHVAFALKFFGTVLVRATIEQFHHFVFQWDAFGDL